MIKGNNGAFYSINLANLETINRSLDFYKTNSFLINFMKKLLKITLFAYGKFFYFSNLLKIESAYNIRQQIQQITGFEVDINEYSAVYISATYTKVIISEPNLFIKYCAEKDVEFIKKEILIYKILNQAKPRTFLVSDLLSYEIQNHFSKVVMSNILQKTNRSTELKNISLALVDFYKSFELKEVTISEYIRDFYKNVELLDVKNKIPNEIISFIDALQLCNDKIKFGLSHNDFKWYNILYTQPITIFDFETCDYGLPLLDLFNYLVDPIISREYFDDEYVYSVILKEKQILNEYLTNVDCNLNFNLIVSLCILDRIVFWSKYPVEIKLKNYLKLLEKVLNEK